MKYEVQTYTANGKLLATYNITKEQYMRLYSCSKNSTVSITDNNIINYYYINNKSVKYQRKKEIIKLYIKQICRKVDNLRNANNYKSEMDKFDHVQL